MSDFEEARDKILMGVARTTLVISDRERRMTAIHEAGHALLHYFLKNADPLHKVTIVPHGRALGMAMSLPEEDSYSRTRGWIEDRIVICYGGWVAERSFYSETTTGTKQDIEQATEMARRMVCEWGMAEELGPVTYGQEEEPIFLGKEIARHKDYSEDTARQIDQATKRILDTARESAERIIGEHRGELEQLAEALLIKETLLDDEIRGILGLPRRENASPFVDTPVSKGGEAPETAEKPDDSES
jgi:cell division protease FtsH